MKIKENVAYHCPTEELAEELFKCCMEQDIPFANFDEHFFWYEYEEQTYYIYNAKDCPVLQFGKLELLKKNNIEIIQLKGEENKMTNREKYKDEIIDLTITQSVRAIGIDKITMKIMDCSNIECSKCYFCGSNDSCADEYKKYMDSEYIKPPKQPTKQDISLMQFYADKGFKYFAMDKEKGGIIYAYNKTPVKFKYLGIWFIEKCSSTIDSKTIEVPILTHLAWEDEQPYFFDKESTK